MVFLLMHSQDKPNYDAWPVVQPFVGAHVAFRVSVLEIEYVTAPLKRSDPQVMTLSHSYTPEVSDYYEGRITALDDTAVDVQLLRPPPEKPIGMITRSRLPERRINYLHILSTLRWQQATPKAMALASLTWTSTNSRRRATQCPCASL